MMRYWAGRCIVFLHRSLTSTYFSAVSIWCMSLVFETIQTEGLAELSYLVGDDEEGIAAVFDPRADVEVYLELARAKNVAITHIFETHIHADIVSGARELFGRVESAKKIG